MAASRRRWLWLLLPLLAVIGFFLLRAVLQPERVTAFLLRQGEQATGLTLSLEQPADIGLWPDLHLELIGLTATAPGGIALLHAKRVDVALPWSALTSDTLQLQRLRLIEPRLDVRALQAWLALGRDDGPPAPLRLPQLDAALDIEAGTVVAQGWSIDGFALRLPSLRSGVATTLETSGSLVRGTSIEHFDVILATTPTLADFAIDLAPLTLTLASTALPEATLQLAGELHFALPDTLRLRLATDIPTWPTTWPALPLASTDAAVPTHIQFDFDGRTDAQGALALLLTRGDERIAAELAIGDLAAWLSATDASPLPPLRGSIDAPRLQSGSVIATGVTLRIDDTATPPPADAKP